MSTLVRVPPPLILGSSVSPPDDCSQHTPTMEKAPVPLKQPTLHPSDETELDRPVSDTEDSSQVFSPINLRAFLGSIASRPWSLPPFRVDDINLLYYDVFLLINLVVSISLYVTHRLDVSYLGIAFSEGCLLSIAWVCSGLLSTGAFLKSAIDGQTYEAKSKGSDSSNSSEETHFQNSPGLVACSTFVNAMNLRLILALGSAAWEHVPVGSQALDSMLPLEMAFGLVLMTVWRTIYAFVVQQTRF
jgi:hypothetical protein